MTKVPDPLPGRIRINKHWKEPLPEKFHLSMFWDGRRSICGRTKIKYYMTHAEYYRRKRGGDKPYKKICSNCYDALHGLIF